MTRFPQILCVVAYWLLSQSESKAEEPQLASVEVRLGQGGAVGGGAGDTTWRFSPLSVSALASLAIQEQPKLSVVGGLYFEGRGRASVGITSGVRVQSLAGTYRASVAAIAIALPFTAFGVSTAVGRCTSISAGLGFCTDVEATVFGLGSDIPDGRIVAQLQAVLGIAFDVL